MISMANVFLKAMLVGVGGTIVLDLYALMMSRVPGVPATNWESSAAGLAIWLTANSFTPR